MPAKFVVTKSSKGFHWSLLAANGRVIASSEHYESRRAAMAGIESVRKNAPKAAVVDGDEVPPKIAAAKDAATRVGKGVADKVAGTRVGKGVAKTVAGRSAPVKGVAKTVAGKVAALRGGE